MNYNSFVVAIVQLLSQVWPFVTPWTAAHQASLSFIISWSLLKLMSVESVIPSKHLILCCPLLLLPSIFPSIRIFPKSWLFASGRQSTGASPSVSSLPMSIQGWFPLGLAGLISLPSKEFLSLLQYHSSKASLLRCSVFFMVQLSHLYMTTRKTIALIIQIFISKVRSLLFNMLSRFVIAFLPRRKCLLISWQQSPSAVILEPPQNKVCHCFHFFPIYLPWSDGTGCHYLIFLNVEF